jgi:hypothetical protein
VEEILAALARTGGNLRHAARLLGCGRGPLRRRVAREGLDAHVTHRASPARRAPGDDVIRRALRRPPGPPRDVVLHVPEDDGVRVVRNVAIDLPVVSVNAAREHWGARQHRRAKVHRVIQEAFGVPGWKPPVLPVGWKWLVTFTRYGRLKLDRDNAITCFKEHIDSVAEDVLGLKSDADPRFEFQVAQVQKSVRGEVRRFDRTKRKSVMVPGFKSWFRVRLEMVRVEGAPIRWAVTERLELGTA